MPKFSQDLFDTICERIADGESLRKICTDDDMPSRVNVMRWLAGSEELRIQYARAREEQADTIFDEILDIADDARNDWVEDGEGGERYNGDHVQRSRLRIDARKWMAGKLRPKKYGEKMDHSVSVDDPLSSLLKQVAAKGRRVTDHDDGSD